MFSFWRDGFHGRDLLSALTQREEQFESQPEISAFVMEGDHGVFSLLVAQPSVEQWRLRAIKR